MIPFLDRVDQDVRRRSKDVCLKLDKLTSGPIVNKFENSLAILVIIIYHV